MPIALTDADKAGLTPAEIEALTGADSDKNLAAFGESPEPDDKDEGDDDDAAAAAAAPAPVPAPAAPAAAATPPTEEELADALVDAPAAPRRFEVEAKDFKAERATLETKIEEIETKWEAGELTDAEKKAELRPLINQKDELLLAQGRAETLKAINEQTAETSMADACMAVAIASKKAGQIDYGTDAEARDEFDGFLSAHARKNPTLPAAALAEKAHKSMLALRGIVAAAPPPPPPPPPAGAPTPPAARQVPVTLGGVPSAAPTGMEDEVMTKLNGLDGEEYEEAFEALPKAQQDRILQAADATAFQHTRTGRQGSRNRPGKADRATEQA